ncbi:IQ domain-containing protein K isoform X3 [Hippopotamus amphibius kiboko]|uniref:IQ domain-containing protein K isoform X3 n=1 Tax=Hippopotamus amphibius kiboko TaxID=575201 RepID=UPI002591A2D8|nr:IQ domain-containing protein K isoform X3 [Hippopotamus amphibius kiboko]
MAAPGQVCRPAPRLGQAVSTESSITARTPVPVVFPVSLDLPVSPGQAVELPGRNLWEQICEEYEAELPPFPEGYTVKQEAVVTVSPLEETVFHGFNAEHLYPAPRLAVLSQVPCPQPKRETVDPKTCSPKEYLETFIFPVLLPGMASLLHQAKKEKCFEAPPTQPLQTSQPTRPPQQRRVQHSVPQNTIQPLLVAFGGWEWWWGLHTSHPSKDRIIRFSSYCSGRNAQF